MQTSVSAIDDQPTGRSGAHPMLFVLDHSRAALDALVSDLSRRFGNDFTVSGDTCPDVALVMLHELAATERRVALLLVDDTFAERFLASAHQLHPQARRVLLIDRDYSSTSPAIQAITLGRADYHIVRPWADVETMYRAMSEYLAAWTKEQEPAFAEFRIVAHENDGRALQLRDVLTRFNMPFRLFAPESEAAQRLLDAAGVDATRLPILVRYDGQVTVDPSLPDLARAVGVRIENDIETTDLAIVGAGPAGLTAAVHAASEGLDTVLLERGVSGGQAGASPLIRNYPGFPHGIDGGTLMERTCEQAWLMGAHIVFAQQAVGLEWQGDDRLIQLLDGSVLHARAVVIATGMNWRRLEVPQLEALVGRGVFYGAATSESRAMQGENVLVLGSGNSAGQAALHLAKHAATVTLLARRYSLATSMSSYLIRAIDSASNVTVRAGTEVVGGGGDERLEYVQVAEGSSGSVEALPAAALFIMIGGQPQTQWLPEQIARDEQGYLLTGRDLAEHNRAQWNATREPLTLETNIPGVFAAGDVRHGSIKRVASAVGDAATSIRLVHDYLQRETPSSSKTGCAGRQRTAPAPS